MIHINRLSKKKKGNDCLHSDFRSLGYVDNLYSLTILNPEPGYYTIPDPAHA